MELRELNVSTWAAGDEVLSAPLTSTALGDVRVWKVARTRIEASASSLTATYATKSEFATGHNLRQHVFARL